MGFSIFAILPQIRVLRARLTWVAMAQAAILWFGIWLLLAGMTVVIVSNWIPFWLFLNSALMGLMMAMYFPHLFVKQKTKQTESASVYVMIYSMIAAVLFGYLGFSFWAFSLPLLLAISILIKAKSWLAPSPAFVVKQFKSEGAQTEKPSVAKWHLELQQYMRVRFDRRGLLSYLAWGVLGIGFMFLLQYGFGKKEQEGINTVFLSVLFPLMFSGSVMFVQERKSWPYLWLRQLHSREALWKFSERHFWLMQLIVCVAFGAATLWIGLINFKGLALNIVLWIASLSLVRYGSIAIPWFSWGQFKTGGSESFISIFLVFVLWMVVLGVVQSGDLIIIAGVTATLILASAIARCAARNKMMRIDLAAFRRSGTLN
jgi:hypothetical protein